MYGLNRAVPLADTVRPETEAALHHRLVAMPPAGLRLERRGCVPAGPRIRLRQRLDLPRRIACNIQPIDQGQVLFNILAPATIQKHATAGFTYRPNRTSEWSFAYMHAFEQTVRTAQSAFGVPASIKMYQNPINLSYSLLF